MDKNKQIIKDHIAVVLDFPKKGISFKDITPLFADPKVFELTIMELCNLIKDYKFDCIAGIESRGFWFALPMAQALNLPFVPIRKKGKLPRETVEAEYSLEYGKDVLQVHKEDIRAGSSVLVVDDIVATGDLQDNGELIWIVPSNIFTNTSSKKLNEIIFNNFSITYWEQIKENVWDDAAVPTAIIKLIKCKNHPKKLNYFFENGKIIFGAVINIKQKVTIKVGGASGNNNNLQPGTTEFITSQTERTGKTKFICYNPKAWIRPTPKAPENFTYQIFVNCKTRKEKPFYILNKLKKSQFINYDASVLCLYLFGSKKQQDELLTTLNNYNWQEAGIKKDGRFHFSQSILQAILKQEKDN